MELEKRKTNLQTKRHPQLMMKKDLQARSSIAGTVELNMVQESVLHMAKHATIVRNEITSRVSANHRKNSMDWT